MNTSIKKLTDLKEQMIQQLNIAKSIVSENMRTLKAGQTIRDMKKGLGQIVDVSESHVVVDWMSYPQENVNHISARRFKIIVSESMSMLIEDDMEKAKCSLAAKEIRDKLMKSIKDINALQIDDLMPLIDAIAGVYGPQQAQSFQNVVGGALDDAMNSVKAAKEKVQGAIIELDAQGPGNDMANFGGDNSGMNGGDMGAPGGDMGGDMGAPGGDMGQGMPGDQMGGQSAPNDGTGAPQAGDEMSLDQMDNAMSGDGDNFEGDLSASGPEVEPLGRGKKPAKEGTRSKKNPLVELTKLIGTYLQEKHEEYGDETKFNAFTSIFIDKYLMKPSIVGNSLGRKYFGESYVFPKGQLSETFTKASSVKSIGQKVLIDNKMSDLIGWMVEYKDAQDELFSPDAFSRLLAETSLNPYAVATCLAYEKFGIDYMRHYDDSNIFENDMEVKQGIQDFLANVNSEGNPTTFQNGQPSGKPTTSQNGQPVSKMQPSTPTQPLKPGQPQPTPDAKSISDQLKTASGGKMIDQSKVAKVLDQVAEATDEHNINKQRRPTASTGQYTGATSSSMTPKMAKPKHPSNKIYGHKVGTTGSTGGNPSPHPTQPKMVEAEEKKGNINQNRGATEEEGEYKGPKRELDPKVPNTKSSNSSPSSTGGNSAYGSKSQAGGSSSPKPDQPKMASNKASGTGGTGTGNSKDALSQMGDVSKKSSGGTEKTGDVGLSANTKANIAGANPAAGKYPNTTNVYTAKNSGDGYAYESFSGSKTPLAQMGNVQKKPVSDLKQGATGHASRVAKKASAANPASGKVPSATDEPNVKNVKSDSYAYESFSGSKTPLAQMGNVQKKATKDQKQGATGHGSAVKKRSSAANPASGKVPGIDTPKSRYVNSDSYAYE